MYISEAPDKTWPASKDNYKRPRSAADITIAMSRGALADSSDEREATPSPDRHNLRSGKQPLRRVPTRKKKRKAITPPCGVYGINIRDSLPHKGWGYIRGLESEDDNPEDTKMLMSRTARRATAAPPLVEEGTSTVRNNKQIRSPDRQVETSAIQADGEVPELEREAQARGDTSASAMTLEANPLPLGFEKMTTPTTKTGGPGGPLKIKRTKGDPTCK